MTCLISIYLTCICPEISTALRYSATGPAASIPVIVIITDTCRERTTATKGVRKENFKGLSFVLRKKKKKQQKKTAVCFFHKLTSFFYAATKVLFVAR